MKKIIGLMLSLLFIALVAEYAGSGIDPPEIVISYTQWMDEEARETAEFTAVETWRGTAVLGPGELKSYNNITLTYNYFARNSHYSTLGYGVWT